MPESRKDKAASSLFFKLTESFGTQIISFVVGIVLGRLLDPTDYGVLTMLTVFITISQVFVQSGLNTALVQKKDVDDEETSSVLYVSLAIAAVLYGVLFFLSPVIARFYRMPELKASLRVLSLILLPGAFISVEHAVIAREMRFRRSMIASVIATVLSGAVGVFLAYRGAKHWALVGQQLVYHFSLALILFLRNDWRPVAAFSPKKTRVLLRFGRRILFSSLLDTGYTELRAAVIGRRFSAGDLGYYDRGRKFPEMVMNAVNNSIQSVMLPVLSEVQDEKDRLRAILRRTEMTSCFLAFPVMAGMAAVARPMVSLLLTDKWLPCVPFLQICCIDLAFYPVHSANLQAINAQGHSEIFLLLELIKKSYGLVILAVSVFCFRSVEIIAWGGALSTVISVAVNSRPNAKLLGYGCLPQMRDVLPSLLSSLILFFAVSALGRLSLPALPLLLLQIVSGVALYLALALILRNPALGYLTETLRSLLKKTAK